MNFKTLKNQHRAQRSLFNKNLSVRVHRALSWLDKAEQSQDDLDAQFIFLWIAFNAAYANEIDEAYRSTEQETFRQFIDRLCEFDKDGHLFQLVWTEFSGSIRVLLANKFVFKPFWDFQNEKISEDEWEASFKKANASANLALANEETEAVLSIIFSRLYMLRNQLLHGGATWNSATNRAQMRDAVNFLAKFIPIIIEIMMNNANQLWGDARFPVVE